MEKSLILVIFMVKKVSLVAYFRRPFVITIPPPPHVIVITLKLVASAFW